MSKQTEWTDEFGRVEKRIRDWQENHPKSTLTEMQTAVEAELTGMRTRIISDMLREHEKSGEHHQCPQCQQPMVSNGRRKRRLQDKEDTELIINRKQMRCQRCGLTHFPPR